MSLSRPAAAFAAAAALAGLLALFVAPEWRAYRGKRRLREGQDLLVAAAAERDAAAREGILRDAEEVLDDAAGDLPHDARPPYLLGSIALLRGDFSAALDHYRRSLAIEERPETDLNLSRAHAGAGESEAAAADALRAYWLAPDLVRELPADARPHARWEIQYRWRRFLAGREGLPPLWPEPGISSR